MDETKRCLKRLIDQMSEVILNLLSSLDVNKFGCYICQKINVLIVHLFAGVYLFHFETHIATYSTNAGVFLHKLVHFYKSCALRLKAHIQKNGKLWPKFFTEAIEEPVVGRQFTAIFVFDTHKKVHNSMRSCIFLFLGFSQLLNAAFQPFSSVFLQSLFKFLVVAIKYFFTELYFSSEAA
jgi:hypothetical protein